MRGSHDVALLDTLICKHAFIIAWTGRNADRPRLEADCRAPDAAT